jgi:hypothetical protein
MVLHWIVFLVVALITVSTTVAYKTPLCGPCESFNLLDGGSYVKGILSKYA